MIKSLGFERGSDDTSYDLSELINKYRSGASISELSNISLQKKTNSKKTNSLFSNIDGLYFLTHEEEVVVEQVSILYHFVISSQDI